MAWIGPRYQVTTASLAPQVGLVVVVALVCLVLYLRVSIEMRRQIGEVSLVLLGVVVAEAQSPAWKYTLIALIVAFGAWVIRHGQLESREIRREKATDDEKRDKQHTELKELVGPQSHEQIAAKVIEAQDHSRRSVLVTDIIHLIDATGLHLGRMERRTAERVWEHEESTGQKCEWNISAAIRRDEQKRAAESFNATDLATLRLLLAKAEKEDDTSVDPYLIMLSEQGVRHEVDLETIHSSLGDLVRQILHTVWY